MEERYRRNMSALSESECELLRTKKVCVVGCGGLGGYIVEILARIGVGSITAVDGDVFDVTNLNRQLLSSEAAIGKSKAEAALKRISEINSGVRAAAIKAFLTSENSAEILSGHDLVVDALDSAGARRVLADACARLGLTIVHGAIGGWYGQVAVVPPGSGMFDILYPVSGGGSVPTSGNPPFTPAVCASIQASEAVKLLCGRPSPLMGKLLLIDLKNQEYEKIDILG